MYVSASLDPILALVYFSQQVWYLSCTFTAQICKTSLRCASLILMLLMQWCVCTENVLFTEGSTSLSLAPEYV